MSWLLEVALTPVGPVVLYLSAALFLGVLSPARWPRLSRGLATAAALGAFVWTLAWVLLPVRVAGAFALSPPEFPPLTLRLAVAPELEPLIAVMALLSLVGLWESAPARAHGRSAWAAGMLLIAGSFVVLVAANFPAVLLGWALVDGGTIVVMAADARRGHRANVGLYLITLAILWIVVLAAHQGDVSNPWGGLRLPTWAHVALGFTVWVRLAAFPFPAVLSHELAPLPLFWSWAPLLAAAGWLAHWTQVPGSIVVWSHPAWVASAVLALTATAVEVWLTWPSLPRLQGTVRQRWSALLLVPWVWPVGASQAIAVLAGAVILAASLWWLAETLPVQAQRLLRWVAAAWLWGVPGTLAGPWREVPLAAATMAPFLMSVLILADAFVACALLAESHSPQRERDSHWVMAIPLAIFLVAWTVLAPSSLTGVAGGWLWSTAVPLLLGILLAWQYARLHQYLAGWKWVLETITNWQPVLGAAQRAVRWAALALGGVATLIEGAGWFGWILTGALILWLWLSLWGGG